MFNLRYYIHERVCDMRNTTFTLMNWLPYVYLTKHSTFLKRQNPKIDTFSIVQYIGNANP